MKNKLAFALLGFFALAGTGCVTSPNVLIGQGFVSERVVRFAIQPTGQGTQETGALFNLLMRMCNASDNGTTDQCKDTLLLENVMPRSVY
ncbi:MAG: hypothetical protein HYV07_08585 [Deltaproteobacteria bacterium]|nr:hypothetical protein [Deltaproteobacteria bacterium]